jgi:hypothetical protein
MPGTVSLTIGSRVAFINGVTRVRLDEPARMMNGTIYVSPRFLRLVTGERTVWDQGSRTLIFKPAPRP